MSSSFDFTLNFVVVKSKEQEKNKITKNQYKY